MTELEFEKACRGTLAPVANEYAWGTTTVTPATGISNGGANNESASNAGANMSSNGFGPLRVGIFAGSATTRVQAGATYYGIMEMSGGVFEKTITVADAKGREYTGAHGDGVITSAGEHNVSGWLSTSGEVLGVGTRGGAWNTNAGAAYTTHAVSSRNSARYYPTLREDRPRKNNHGGRGVRTAPTP
jgi:formylglycine-generating enzyme required for sulfatase activity